MDRINLFVYRPLRKREVKVDDAYDLVYFRNKKYLIR